MTIKDTVEERILELQEKKRELANATIEGKMGANKLTMKDMLALFRHDAENTHQVDNVGLNLAAKTKLLVDDSPNGSPQNSPKGSRTGSPKGSDGRKNQGRKVTPAGVIDGRSKVKKEEDSVYGRRW